MGETWLQETLKWVSFIQQEQFQLVGRGISEMEKVEFIRL